MNAFEYGFYDELEKLANFSASDRQDIIDDLISGGFYKEAASLKQKLMAGTLALGSLFGGHKAYKAYDNFQQDPVRNPEARAATGKGLPTGGNPLHRTGFWSVRTGDPRLPYYVDPDRRRSERAFPSSQLYDHSPQNLGLGRRSIMLGAKPEDFPGGADPHFAPKRRSIRGEYQAKYLKNPVLHPDLMHDR